MKKQLFFLLLICYAFAPAELSAQDRVLYVCLDKNKLDFSYIDEKLAQQGPHDKLHLLIQFLDIDKQAIVIDDLEKGPFLLNHNFYRAQGQIISRRWNKKFVLGALYLQKAESLKVWLDGSIKGDPIYLGSLKKGEFDIFAIEKDNFRPFTHCKCFSSSNNVATTSFTNKAKSPPAGGNNLLNQITKNIAIAKGLLHLKKNVSSQTAFASNNWEQLSELKAFYNQHKVKLANSSSSNDQTVLRFNEFQEIYRALVDSSTSVPANPSTSTLNLKPTSPNTEAITTEQLEDLKAQMNLAELLLFKKKNSNSSTFTSENALLLGELRSKHQRYTKLIPSFVVVHDYVSAFQQLGELYYGLLDSSPPSHPRPSSNYTNNKYRKNILNTFEESFKDLKKQVQVAELLQFKKNRLDRSELNQFHLDNAVIIKNIQKKYAETMGTVGYLWNDYTFVQEYLEFNKISQKIFN